MKDYIESILRRLGITRKYIGYYAVLYSVILVIEDESRLLKVTKQIYQPVSEMCGCKLSSVERNIRTVIFIAWDANRTFLNELFGFELNAPPSVSQFIDVLAVYAQRTYVFSQIK